MIKKYLNQIIEDMKQNPNFKDTWNRRNMQNYEKTCIIDKN